MNKLSKKTSKREILKYMVIIMLFNIAIIMCLGINNKDNKVISKNNSKNIIHKEVVDGVEIEILADSGVFPKDASVTIKKLEKQAETDKVKDAISKSAESSSKNINSVYSYDITIKDSKGKELQPDTSKGEVIVVFKDIQGLDKNNGKSVKVWHVKDDLDEAEEVNSGVEVCENRVDIKVQHFSIYSVVINEEQDKTIKYFEGASNETSYFMIEDAEDLCIFRDIVNGNISNTDPILVEYENEDANNKKEDINNNISTLGENARLVSNIDMLGIDWTPIGTDEHEFTGIFVNTNFEYNSDEPEDVDNPKEYSISGINKDRLFNNYAQAKIHVTVGKSVLDVNSSNIVLTRFLGGAGTVKSPYLIKTAEDLIYMRDTINKGMDGIINGTKSSVEAISACYRLEEDIEVSDWKSICPVEDAEIAFKGIFDGKENNIKYSSTIGGLFGNVSDKGIIRNLTVEGIITKALSDDNRDGKADEDKNMYYLGTLVGNNYGNIVNCNIGGSITTENNIIYKNIARIGGVAGCNSGVMSDVECKVQIDVKNINDVMLGGIVGANEKNAKVEGCSYKKSVDEFSITLDDLGGNAGGIVGYNVGEINKVLCKTNTKIKGNDKCLKYGGICGENGFAPTDDEGKITNAMVNSEITLATSGVYSKENYIGGIVGEVFGDGIIGNSYANVNIKRDSNAMNNGLKDKVYIGVAVGYKAGNRKNKHYINCCYSIMNIDNNISHVGETFGSSSGYITLSVEDYWYIIKNDNDIIKDSETNIEQDFNLKGALNEKSNSTLGYCGWVDDTNNDNNNYPILDFTKEEVKPSYKEVNASTINIYGNGCSIIIKSQSGETVFYQDKKNIGVFDEGVDKKINLEVDPLADKIINVFGGSENKLYSDTRITMLGGTVTNIYGGGYSASSEVNSTFIAIYGGTVTGNVYGGSLSGLVKGSSTINISGGTIDNVYGGSYKGLVNGSSTINISGGTITDVYGAGQYITVGDSGKVLCGTTINITGGIVTGIINANGISNSGNEVRTIGNRVINVSGSPIIGTQDGLNGIKLDSFTNKKIIVNKAFSLREDNMICVITTPDLRKKIALLKSREYADVNQFYINDLTTSVPRRTLFKYNNNSANKVEILIAEQLSSELLSSESTNVISNDTKKELGYGFGPYVAKGYEWKGTIKANPGYTLPPTIEVKIGGNDVVQGKDYKYDKYTGEVTVFKGKTTGNIKVTANAIYVPPIIAVDKPFVSTTDFSYTGTPQSPILIDTDKYTVSVTRETNVGEYTMVVSLKDKVYTRWNDGTNDDLYIKWRINKVDMKVIAKDKSITYGDSPTNAGVSYEGFVNGEDESVLKGTLSYVYDYNLYDNVGNYVITPKGYEADNYNITYTSGTLKVFPKKLSFNWSSPSKFKYDGKVKVMTASIVGIVNNDDVRIVSYAHNKIDKVGTYVAKVTGITGTKKDNYTLEGATNISKKWSIVKNEDKEEDKDKNENKDNIKDNGDKNDTSGPNNNKGNVNNNNNNNSSNNTSSNKGNNNNTNKNQSNGNYANVNMYDKLANNNDYKTDIEGAIEGVKTSDNEIQVELNNGMVISAMGDFEESIRLMVKEIKNKRKEWRWINSLTKDIGTNKGLYDIFFVNSKGVKVNTGKGTKISILSREKLQKADVYYIRTSSERLKLKSWKEEYTVKFRMIENGYYTLILNDKNNLIEGKGEDVTVVDKDSTTDNNDKNANKDADTINDKDNQDGTEENKTNVNDSKDGDSGSEINTSQDSTNHNIQNTDKQQKEKEDGINWVIIISIILVIIVTIIVSVFILKRFSKDRYE